MKTCELITDETSPLSKPPIYLVDGNWLDPSYAITTTNKKVIHDFFIWRLTSECLILLQFNKVICTISVY